MIPENIKKACEFARNPGGCCYVDSLGPCCVIGHLAVLEGISLETIGNRDSCQYIKEFKPLLDKYGNGLSKLQEYWDHDINSTFEANNLLLEYAETLDWPDLPPNPPQN